MTRRLLGMLAAFAALLLIGASSASAITGGQPDGSGHPYVGLMVAYDAGGTPRWRCSGTLMSDTVFLTAGHCAAAPAVTAQIWFDQGPIPAAMSFPATGADPCAGVNGYPCKGDAGGKVYTEPDFDPNAFFYRDLGVVVLSAPYVMRTYGQLPQENTLDALKTKRGRQDARFTTVGYGAQASFPNAASWKDLSERVRMVATPRLIQIDGGQAGDFGMVLSNNANTGGVCFGDSGGPTFLGGPDSNVVVGVTSGLANDTCAGIGLVFRVDRSWSLDWLALVYGLTSSRS